MCSIAFLLFSLAPVHFTLSMGFHVLQALLRLFGTIVSHGGQPREDNRDGSFGLTYPMRPGYFAFCLCMLVVAVWLLQRNLPLSLRHRLTQVPLREATFMAFLLLAGLLLPTRVVRLDEQGLSSRWLLGPKKIIGWSEFSHVEQYRSGVAGKSTWYFRSRLIQSKVRTITLSEMAYNTDNLITALRQRIALPERPRKRAHWWGG